MDEISPAASIDQTINSCSAHYPDAIRLASFVLERHWSAFTCLDEESKQRGSTGIHLAEKMLAVGVEMVSVILKDPA